MDGSVGLQLRTAREARGWSLDEVALKLKIPARYVAALEGDDVAALPEATFVRGYVKAYAKATGLDADALLGSLAPVEVKAPKPLIGPDGAVGARRTTGSSRSPSFRNSGSRRLRIVAGIAIVGIVAWYIGTSMEKSGGTPSTPAVQSVATPAPAVTVAVPAAGNVLVEVPLPGATPAPLPAVVASTQSQPMVPVVSPAAAVAAPTNAGALPASGTVQPQPAGAALPPIPAQGLYLRFSGACWIEVRDVDNTVLLTRMATGGSDLTVSGKAPLTVTLGDASTAQLWYNGEKVAADRFARTGVARLIVGQKPR